MIRRSVMAGKIFYRERRKVEKGEKKPRYTVAAVYDIKLDFVSEHFRKSELEEIATAIGAELVFLTNDRETKKHDS
jgi:hypothetical protein